MIYIETIRRKTHIVFLRYIRRRLDQLLHRLRGRKTRSLHTHPYNYNIGNYHALALTSSIQLVSKVRIRLLGMYKLTSPPSRIAERHTH